jgi:metallopeptidase MepB
MLKDGTRQFPSTALLGSWPKPSSGDPSLLQHSDVVLLFHELGHCIHELVALTKNARFHGTASPVDFAEAPSQMLENWCWIPSQLKRLGRHYSYTSPDSFQAWTKLADGKLRPPERLYEYQIEGILRSKHVNSALMYLRQLSIGIFDMMVHKLNGSMEAKDWNLAVKWTQVRSRILPIAGGEALPGQEDWSWSHSYASFGHFVDNYDAGYYSYML